MMIKRFSNLPAGGKAFFVLDHLPAHAPLVAVVLEEDLPSWEGNLAALSAGSAPVPVRVFLPHDHFGQMHALRTLAAGGQCVVLATAASLAEKTTAPEQFSRATRSLNIGAEYPSNEFIAALAAAGYQRVDFVEEKGQFSRRGEIIDIWPADQNGPWRLVFAHNTLESLREFDVVTQRSGEFRLSAELLPARAGADTLLSAYLPPESILYFDAPPDDTLPSAYRAFSWLVNDALAADAVNAGFTRLARWNGNIPLFIRDLAALRAAGNAITIYCANQGEKERIEDILFEHHGTGPALVTGPLAESFTIPERKSAFISGQEILYQRRPVSFPKFKGGRRLEGLWEISAGDYVVHERYGIGRYLGLRKISRGEHESEYLCLEYKGGDKLYVPPDDFRVVQKYVGVEGYRPRLFSLDTGTWERAKQRAAASAKELAEELLKLYAERHAAPGYACGEETPWERELADSFPYQETQDQLKAIADVMEDLRQPSPMERLICGDVGFGKTEVAIRAAFKVVQDGRQVAVLVPTTVLAEQHYATFSGRLAPFPTRVGLLNRFQQKKDQNDAIAAVATGGIDIVVGTHRLLSKDIRFKDLGLLIIDEEHRFGVRQKEKIKALKKNVDVLLLSATPIPRTLSLAMAGLRDLSVIETPPYGRLPIETHCGPYDEKLVKRIIQAELSRNGQVYYVHNRVETIYARAAYLKNLLPDIRWGVIHGQMPGPAIEKTMWQFMHRQIDVLIATSIIESGLDIPSVNTMIVEEAENFGLAQLYQLRGRIGREKQKAYCYLFYTPELLTGDSRKRLESLAEFNELGSGFRLALRDLEIRGAGNILSARQHGFVKEIGFDMYSRLLEEASAALHGKPAREARFVATVDFAMAAFFPASYIEQEDLRVLFYRRLASAQSAQDLAAAREELIDRFGALPSAVENIFSLTALRMAAETMKISSVTENGPYYDLYLSPAVTVTPEKILRLAADYQGMIEFMRGDHAGIRFKKDQVPRPAIAFLTEFILNFNRYAVVSTA